MTGRLVVLGLVAAVFAARTVVRALNDLAGLDIKHHSLPPEQRTWWVRVNTTTARRLTTNHSKENQP